VRSHSSIELSSRCEAIEAAVRLFERAIEHVEIRLGRGDRESSAAIDGLSAHVRLCAQQ
jgi:hypothetical protein